MNQNMDDRALQDLIKGIAKNASKKSTANPTRRRKKSSTGAVAEQKGEAPVKTMPVKAKKVVKKKEAKKHIVVFQDEAGNVLKTTFVEEGKDAEPPVLPQIKEELEHHRILFAGWDHEGKNVRSNLVIKPIYEKVAKQYLVMYLSEAGKVIGTEKVAYGQSAMNEYPLEKASTPEFDYTFLGWSHDLSFIEKDMMVKPIFRPNKRKYTIRFLGDRNRVLDTQTVKYGEMPKAPATARKEENPTYTYHFAGWDREIVSVSESTQYYAVFHPVYKEYQFKAYLEDELIEEKIYHYKDKLTYPAPSKKGYDLIWDIECDEITDHLTIHGNWDFSNKKGSILEHKSGRYRILNPSVSGGTVSLIQCYDHRAQVTIPERILLGDYYYKIIKIEKNAFSSCPKLKQLILGNNIEEIEDRGLAGCTGLKKITFGKNVKVLGKQICYGTKSLSEIRIKGSKLKKISSQTFDHMHSKVKVKADNILPFQLKKLFAKGIAAGNIVL